MDSTNDPTEYGRRLRLSTPVEQQEFVRLGRQLIDGGMTVEDIQRELGYEELEAVRTALSTGRVTTARLEKLRELIQQRMPDIVERKTAAHARQGEERLQRTLERFRQETAAAERDGADGATSEAAPSVPTAPAGRPAARAAAALGPAAARRRRSDAGRPKEYLTPKQHTRLKEQIEHLWAVDKRFKNWSLLAKVGGLKSGQAMKRAYEVGSSVGTLSNVETFARLHAGFGSRATRALQRGVPIEELQAFLTSGGADGAEPEVEAPRAAGGRGRRRRASGPVPSSAAGLPETPPSIDFASIIELGQAIDTEVKRMWLMSRFFEGLSEYAALPRFVRANARATRDKLREAIAIIAPELADEDLEAASGEATQPGATEGAEPTG